MRFEAAALYCCHGERIRVQDILRAPTSGGTLPVGGRAAFSLVDDGISRKKCLKRAPFGAISKPGGLQCAWSIFNGISNGRNRFREVDLKRFAERNGLPVAYVRPFFQTLLQSRGKMDANRPDVDFATFQRYVVAREGALKKVFEAIDTDRDGRVTVEELRIGLSHLIVTCPNSRCCYRSKTCSIDAVLNSASPGGMRGNVPRGMTYCDFRKRFLLLPQDQMLVEYWLCAGHPSICDVSCPVQYYQDLGRKKGSSPWGHLFAGAVAGGASRTVTAPLETLRIMAMTGALEKSGRGGAGAGLVSAAAGLVRRGGWGALFRGNCVNVFRSAPQKALDFFAFDHFKTAFSARRLPAAGSTRGGRGAGSNKEGPPPPAQPGTVATLAAAGLAGAVSSSALYPLEVVRTRMCADTSGVYKGIGQTFALILRTEGAGALYRGIGPSVAAILPEAAITYGLFDLLKRSYVRATGRQSAGVVPSLTAGVVAAFIGQTVAYPLETISRRMQVASMSSSASALQAARLLIQEGGVGALFNGLGAATVRVVPMAIVSFGTYEWVRAQYTKAEERIELETARSQACMLPGCPVQMRV